ncbi:MAG: 16S rRNA (cytosine(1402)-N(4))-methyltransferase RsmH [Acidobacteriota bacterium]
MAGPTHVPVLLEATLDLLEPERGGCYVDCTVGLGGHAVALLERAPTATLIGIDRDLEALAESERRLERFADRVTLLEGRFSDLAVLLATRGVERVAGMLADLGVSSLQLDRGERGFAFSRPGPLDMRMGGEGMSARDIVNTYSEDALARIFHEYGEERQSRRIARAIARRRTEAPIDSTAELAELVERIKGPASHHKTRAPRARRRSQGGRPSRSLRTHPATQVFQALRIEVNQELDELDQLLDQATTLLESGGKLVVISYHSLEDGMVKHRFRALDHGEVDPVTGAPRSETQLVETLTKKPLRPSDDEVEINPRARSARMRAVRKR